jgi:hypothetical protein
LQKKPDLAAFCERAFPFETQRKMLYITLIYWGEPWGRKLFRLKAGSPLGVLAGSQEPVNADRLGF